MDIDNIGPAGAMHSNVEEMASWLLLHLNASPANIISETMLTELHRPQIKVPDEGEEKKEFFDESYGLGWMIGNYRGHKLISHGGGITGFITFVSFMPEKNIGIVSFVNTGFICVSFDDTLVGVFRFITKRFFVVGVGCWTADGVGCWFAGCS